MNTLEFDIRANFEKVRNVIFICTLPLAALAMLVDLIFVESGTFIFVINSLNLIQLIVSFLLYWFRKIDLQKNYAIVIYFLLLNIILSNISEFSREQSIVFFMRDTLSVFILMPLASIVIGKYQNLIIGGIYISFYIVIGLLDKSNFLISNIVWTLTVFGGFSVSMFILMQMVEISLLKQEKLTSKVIVQNRELHLQANNLEEINKLLSQQAIEIKNQKKELQLLNSTKDKMLSLIAHDLKTPINSIIGLLEMVELRYDTMPEERKKYFLQLIKSTSVNAYYLLENLLEWTISQSNSISFKPDRFTIKKLFEQIYDLLGQAARNKKIDLVIQLDKNIEVVADEHMIYSVIRNLVSNGIKYTPEGGKVLIKAEKIENKIRIEVSDTGIGIPEDKIKLLVKHEQTSSTKGTSGESGTGLGLIITNDFLQRHGSSLNIESKQGEGTKFSFDLLLGK